jgi:putative transcriptional regulator
MAKKPRVANRLRELRHEYGLTQEKLAEDLEVTRHTIMALEVGRYVPSIELALRLAAYFDRPLESIFWLELENEEPLLKAVHPQRSSDQSEHRETADQSSRESEESKLDRKR